MEINKEESAEQIEQEQEQNDNIKQRWIPFLSKYCDCRFVSMTKKWDSDKQEYVTRTAKEQEAYNTAANVYELFFKYRRTNSKNGEYKIQFKFEGSNNWQVVQNDSWGHLNYVCKQIKQRYQQENVYWRSFPNWAIAGYIFGFFSVISWVSMGYFANALHSATTKDKSKFSVFINSLASIFDTAACGFILYSLIVGAPMFSIPMIIAAAVSVLLRVIFTVLIFNNIDENKKLITEYVKMDQILEEIEGYLEQYKPKEVQEPDKEVKEFPEKPKENEKDGDGNKDEIGKGN